jgi:HTH-type transcriptional regulator/antitoxin HigA
MNARTAAEVFAPGEYLKDELEARGWSQIELSEVLGRPPRLISEIVSAKRAITPETAKGFAAAFGTSAQLWMNLETAYQLSKAKIEESEVSRRAALYGKYPVKEMIKRGWVMASTSVEVLEQRFEEFFAVPAAHVAKKQKYDDPASVVQRAWVCRARQLAQGVSVAKFSQEKLVTAITELKSRREFSDSVREVPRVLANAGVRVVVVERLPGLKMDGACLWLDGSSPVIALSFQHDRIGNFWHTLFHEIDHIAHGEGKDEAIVEEMPSKSDWDNLPPNERRADEAAANHALSQKELEGFIARVNPLFTKSDILGFARRMEAHPGIVVGQLQWRGLIHYSLYRDTLEKVRDNFVDAALTDGFGRMVPL